MKKIKRWLHQIFDIDRQGIDDCDLDAVIDALNSPQVRAEWVAMLVNELKQIHLQVDSRLLSAREENLIDLCSRRKAFRDVLQMVITAKRIVRKEVDHNQTKSESFIDLDRLTV